MSIVRRPSRRSSGIVLVMVLLGLAMAMILLLALFAGTLGQSHSASSDALQDREKMLADSAVALVIGQIGQASSQAGQTWISQPGLLRTYAADATRKPTACYKLYSTANLADMKDQTGTLAFMAADIPGDWSSRPADYTDLNAQVQSTYPILDPNAVAPAIPGVSTDNGPGHVEMPVAWLYQLQDGTLGPASNGTAANPIVARIAFWTDDETSKININTAGCGSPWNTPRTNSPVDLAWSTTQPAAGEFSAYPGHPATTSLGEVLGSGNNALNPQQLLGLTPRYAWGGSQFGSQSTTAGESVPLKMDRLYASVDELCFSSSLTSGGQRVPNPVSVTDPTVISQFQNQLKTARFVLTAHSEAPETTLLGEPRVAIWPIADSTSTAAPRITATDRAIMTAATVGAGTTNVRNYYFQRNDPLNPLDDFNLTPPLSSPTASNLQLFNELVNRGTVSQPGYGTNFTTAKYPGANWTQIMLEITDFIHATNAVDPSPAPFAPFAAGGAGNIGCGFVDPLTWTYAAGTTNQVTLRGLGRCPTLSSLTLVFYVSGFVFDSTANTNPRVSSIDFDGMTDNDAAQFWTNNLAPSSSVWEHVTGELVRVFAVPCTFHPCCGYPEVDDNCTLQISGLEGTHLSSSSTNDFGFKTPPLSSRVLGMASQVTPPDRAWGGNEGPLAWRAAALDGASGPYDDAFAGTTAAQVNLLPKSQLRTQFTYSSMNGLLWPPNAPKLTIQGTPTVTVLIKDGKGNTLQTLKVAFPATAGYSNFVVPAPTLVNEYTLDGSGNAVPPCYYMTLRNRVLATLANRPFLIQPGDSSRSIEAATDLRVVAALPSVPASMFAPHPAYSTSGQNAHNLHFADGTAVCGASGYTKLASLANYAATTNWVTYTDWMKSSPPPMNYGLSASPRNDCPTTSVSNLSVMMTSSLNGDWDTGPGFAPDGAQINLPDSGTTLDAGVAYQSLSGGLLGAATQRTPNALVPSPVIFGSLPAGINPADSISSGPPILSQPWRTLLFCPYPAANTSATPYSMHPGAASATGPPDHLILDNFWMPVVEPYAISTCMATAGKINLNDQIAPFTYLHRNTALRALLDSLRIPAIPILDAGSPTSPVSYKSKATGAAISSIWNAVDENATLAQIENRFAGGSVNAYLSESEICTVPLVPSEPQPSPFSATDVAAAQAALASFWSGAWSGTKNPDGGLTGDNLRELPYAQLYGRLTTRSNSYTVHLRVQVLKKLTHDPDQNVWKEGTDVVLGDWRGSYEIERYLDPTVPAPTAGTSLAGTVLKPSYKFRIVSAQAFSP